MKIIIKNWNNFVKKESLNEGFGLGALRGAASTAGSMTEALSAMNSGSPFSFPIDADTYSELEGLTTQSSLRGPMPGGLPAPGGSGGLSSANPKLILAAGGTIAILILVAFALKYSVRLKAKVPGGEGEVIFEPQDSKEEEPPPPEEEPPPPEEEPPEENY